MNSRANARVVANVGDRMDGRTNERKTGSLYRAMPEAQQKLNGEMFKIIMVILLGLNFYNCYSTVCA